MFDVHCPRHGSRVLLGHHAIESLANTPDGIVLRWRCHCGARGEQRFGRGRAPHTGHAAAGSPVAPAA